MKFQYYYVRESSILLFKVYKLYHVPTFILISFYFYYRTLHGRIIAKIIARFQRLFIPYIIWPIIIFLINNISFKLFSVGICKKELVIKDIYIQILIGAGYHGVFWFQFNLIFISLYFAIITFVFKKYSLNIIKISGVVFFYFHISGIIPYYFQFYKRQSIVNIGGLFESMPLAVFGILLGSINYLVIFNDCSITSYFFNIFIIYILFEYDIFIKYPGFRYSNICLYIIASISLFTLFGSIHFKAIENNNLNLIIRNVTKFTAGIYYIHLRIRDILNQCSFYSLYLNKNTYFHAFAIYIICYIICFTGNKIFKNSKVK